MRQHIRRVGAAIVPMPGVLRADDTAAVRAEVRHRAVIVIAEWVIAVATVDDLGSRTH